MKINKNPYQIQRQSNILLWYNFQHKICIPKKMILFLNFQFILNKTKKTENMHKSMKKIKNSKGTQIELLIHDTYKKKK